MTVNKSLRNPWTIPMLGLLVAVSVFTLGYMSRGASAQAYVSSLNPPCMPADIAPATETVGGAAGSSPECVRSDARAPRLTRAATVVTTTGGVFSGTWETPLAASDPTIVLTPIAASASVDCQLTAVPTATTFQGRCWTAQPTLLNLSIITTGLTLNPVVTSAAGITVQVIALPKTQ